MDSEDSGYKAALLSTLARTRTLAEEGKLLLAIPQPARNTSSKNTKTNMRAMRAETFSGYEGLNPVDLPKPEVSDGKVLLRMTAAGVTPLDHTILSGHFPLAKAPLVLGNEGAGVVMEGGGTDFTAGSRVMFTGPYGVFEDGAYLVTAKATRRNIDVAINVV